MVQSTYQDQTSGDHSQVAQDQLAPVHGDLPIERPLVFYIGHDKAFYLGRTQTTDEETFTNPQTLLDRYTDRRVLPPAILHQGESGMVKFTCLFLNYDGTPFDLNGLLASFEGSDTDGYPIVTDEGFGTVDAANGLLSWMPGREITKRAGHFRTAHFKLESVDRMGIAITLDFDLHVIQNGVAWPKPEAGYLSEYNRGLLQMHEMQRIYSDSMQHRLDAMELTIADRLQKMTARLSQMDAQLDTIKAAIDKNDLLTKSDAQDQINDLVQKALANNTIDVNDRISDAGTKSAIDKLANS